MGMRPPRSSPGFRNRRAPCRRCRRAQPARRVAQTRPSQAEEEMSAEDERIEIPAFLRRQAN